MLSAHLYCLCSRALLFPLIHLVLQKCTSLSVHEFSISTPRHFLCFFFPSTLPLSRFFLILLGTTSNSRTLLQFKYGAFAPGAPIQREEREGRERERERVQREGRGSAERRKREGWGKKKSQIVVGGILFLSLFTLTLHSTAAVVKFSFSFYDPTSSVGSQLWWVRMFSQLVQVRREKEEKMRVRLPVNF